MNWFCYESQMEILSAQKSIYAKNIGSKCVQKETNYY